MIYFRIPTNVRAPWDKVALVALEQNGELAQLITGDSHTGLTIRIEDLRVWSNKACKEFHTKCIPVSVSLDYPPRFTTVQDVQVACLRLSVPNTHTHEGL